YQTNFSHPFYSSFSYSYSLNRFAISLIEILLLSPILIHTFFPKVSFFGVSFGNLEYNNTSTLLNLFPNFLTGSQFLTECNPASKTTTHFTSSKPFFSISKLSIISTLIISSSLYSFIAFAIASTCLPPTNNHILVILLIFQYIFNLCEFLIIFIFFSFFYLSVLPY